MTYLELYMKAIRKFGLGEITINEYKDIIKPLMEEIRTESWTPCSKKNYRKKKMKRY